MLFIESIKGIIVKLTLRIWSQKIVWKNKAYSRQITIFYNLSSYLIKSYIFVQVWRLKGKFVIYVNLNYKF